MRTLVFRLQNAGNVKDVNVFFDFIQAFEDTGFAGCREGNELYTKRLLVSCTAFTKKDLQGLDVFKFTDDSLHTILNFGGIKNGYYGGYINCVCGAYAGHWHLLPQQG
ncbi:hypothetical protein AGMMS50284_0730 [Clostridia bacterium]|nr:hypothetical protein AGMMS50284_0730 [Clostridia bacterium]